MYKEVGNRYEFDGDFEQYLLGVGISTNHIKMMKERKLQADKERYFSIKEDEKRTCAFTKSYWDMQGNGRGQCF